MTIEDFNRRLSLLSGGIDYTQPLKVIGEEVVKSIKKNFEESGRPEKWEQSIRAKKYGYKTLIKTGTLMRSAAVGSITQNSVTVGTNVSYAQIHNEGGIIKQKTKSGTIRTINMKKRQFFMLQESDIQMANKIVTNFVIKKITGA